MASVISFVVSHQALLAGLGVAVIDLVFALSPSLNGNGMLHAVYHLLVKDVQTAPPAA